MTLDNVLIVAATKHCYPVTQSTGFITPDRVTCSLTNQAGSQILVYVCMTEADFTEFGALRGCAEDGLQRSTQCHTTVTNTSQESLYVT
jgi:hypothetical protein